MCPNYKIFLEEDARRNFLQIVSVIILPKQFGSVVYKNNFSIPDYFWIGRVTVNGSVSLPVNLFCRIDQQIEIMKGTIPYLRNSLNGSKLKRLESMKDSHGGLITNTPTAKVTSIRKPSVKISFCANKSPYLLYTTSAQGGNKNIWFHPNETREFHVNRTPRLPSKSDS